MIQMTVAEQPVVFFRNQQAWEKWLESHFDSSPGVWLRIAKKSAGIESVTYQEALDVALCHGWIDGQKKKFDDESWIQKFTPRGKRSIWSKINRDKTAVLIAQGRMKAAGVAAIDRAKENGQWEAAYDPHSTAVVPEDFQKALDKSRKATKFFEMLNRQNRYAILWRIQTAKKDETRKRRIAQFIEMLKAGETLH
jgi:uncharacterized protein YdeI (YjbR/CyaY-like superfamily)